MFLVKKFWITCFFLAIAAVIHGQTQHTISIDPLGYFSEFGYINAQYEFGLDSKRSLFTRILFKNDTHSTGEQIGIDSTFGVPIAVFDRATHKDIRFDVGYRRFFGKKRSYGGGFFLEGFLTYQPVFDIQEPFFEADRRYGFGYGLGYRYVFDFNVSIGIESHVSNTFETNGDSTGLLSEQIIGFHVGYVFNRQERVQQKSRSRSRR